MRRSRNARFAAGILMLLVAIVFITACSSSDNQDEDDTPAPSSGTVESEIQNFTLENLTVSLGTQVVWKNLDQAQHTSTSGSSPTPDGTWNTGRLSANQSATRITFNEAGTFQYFCTVHPSMQATVTVTN